MGFVFSGWGGCGVEPKLRSEELYDRLDGRRLVPFQAAMTRAAWLEHQKEIQWLIQQQLKACRRIFSGKDQPRIVTTKPARFFSYQPPTPCFELTQPCLDCDDEHVLSSDLCTIEVMSRVEYMISLAKKEMAGIPYVDL